MGFKAVTYIVVPIAVFGVVLWANAKAVPVKDATVSVPYFVVRAGNGGVDLGPGSTIQGGIYSQGSVRAGADSEVVGSVEVFGSGEGIFGSDRWNKVTITTGAADRIEHASSSGALYCKTGSGNNKLCSAPKARFTGAAMPFVEEAVASWKRSASSKTIESSHDVGYKGAVLGPAKIEGNLTVRDGATLTVSGPLWVTGDIRISDGAFIRSGTSGGTPVVISDGSIQISGGAHATTSGGGILFVSTADLFPAISVSGGSLGLSLFAPNGGTDITDGARVNSVAANRVKVSGGARVGPN